MCSHVFKSLQITVTETSAEMLLLLETSSDLGTYLVVWGKCPMFRCMPLCHNSVVPLLDSCKRTEPCERILKSSFIQFHVNKQLTLRGRNLLNAENCHALRARCRGSDLQDLLNTSSICDFIIPTSQWQIPWSNWELGLKRIKYQHCRSCLQKADTVFSALRKGSFHQAPCCLHT